MSKTTPQQKSQKASWNLSFSNHYASFSNIWTSLSFNSIFPVFLPSASNYHKARLKIFFSKIAECTLVVSLTGEARKQPTKQALIVKKRSLEDIGQASRDTRNVNTASWAFFSYYHTFSASPRPPDRILSFFAHFLFKLTHIFSGKTWYFVKKLSRTTRHSLFLIFLSLVTIKISGLSGCNVITSLSLT